MKSVEEIFARLTLPEKAALLAGANAWQTRAFKEAGLPAVTMTDGPNGLRRLPDLESTGLEASLPATCFPAAATLAGSFDPGLVEDVGRALGEEARDQDVQLVLGPGINIKRSPLCGRNFEYYSEDPLVAGTLGAAFIRGLQSTGTGACLKHFAANNREYFRMVANSIVDERALHEIYLRGFALAVRTGAPYAVMSAYNLLNGSYCGETPALVAGILRGSWSFDGIVISDWGAVCSRLDGVRAGMDLQMPYAGPFYAQEIERAVEGGSLRAEDLDACVLRLLRFVEKCEQGRSRPFTCSYEAHHALARRAARESAVLLKNDGALLPLAEGKEIALIGAFAVEPRYQGAGSSRVVPKDLETAYAVFPDLGLPFRYAPGYALSPAGAASAQLRDEAVQLARELGTAVILAGLPLTQEYEGVDRENLDLPADQTELIRAVSGVARTVVVLCCGAPVVMPWLPEADAVLHCYLGGEAGASACAELLTGRANPGGHLAETYPLRLEDTPAHRFFRDAKHNVEYRESTYVGYRFYEAAQKDVLFPFGYGLSYTSFKWSGFAVDTEGSHVTASVTVKNTGSRAGSDLVQVYARGEGQPYAQLAGFRKVQLEPGESASVFLTLDDRSFQFYRQGWHWQNCEVIFGRHAGDVLWKAPIRFDSAQKAPAYPLAPDGAWKPEPFRALFRDGLPVFRVARPFTLNATPADLSVTGIGRRITETLMAKALARLDAEVPPERRHIERQIVDQTPLRAIIAFSGGILTRPLAESILGIVSGRWVRELPRLRREMQRLRTALTDLQE